MDYRTLTEFQQVEAMLRQECSCLQQQLAECTDELIRLKAQLHQEISTREQAEKALHRQQQECKALKEALRSSQQFTQHIADTIPNILYLYDLIEQHNIYTNHSIAEHLGYTSQEIQQMGTTMFQTLLHLDDVDKVTEHLKRCATLQENEILEIEYRVRDASEQWHWLCSRDTLFKRTPDGKPQQILGTATDITQRKQVEAALQLQAKRNRLMVAMQTRIRQSLNLMEILNTTVQEVRQFLQTNRVLIYRFHPDWSGVVIVECVEAGWISILGREIYDTCFAQEICIHPYLQGHIQSTDNIYTANLHQCYVNLLAQFQVKANLVVPILQGEQFWGLLVAQHCATPRQWLTWEIDLLKQLATQVGIATQQAELYQKLEQANHELERLATLDGLTQLANRRRFDDYLEQQWRCLLREQQPLSLILCDLDFFKAYNDTYGHQAGDDCLKRVAEVLHHTVKRPADLVARYGGEEFAVILPRTPSSGARGVAQLIHEAVKNLKLTHAGSTISPYVTLSIGVASVIPCLNISPTELIAAADAALYEVKATGRNCTFLMQL